MENKSKNKIILLIILLMAIAAGLTLYMIWPKSLPQQVSCTQEAKLCPDGSYVGRTGPNCEFNQCPPPTEGIPNIQEWKTSDSLQKNITFRYPEKSTSKYIELMDWPPQIQIINEPFSCIEAGSKSDRAGEAKKLIINNHEFCVTTVGGAAAGSAYNQYAYVFQKENQTSVLTFTVRTPQCANYDELQKTECQKEQAAFDVNAIAEKIISTITFNPYQSGNNNPDQTFCTQEAKLCPDGSYVGRTGPNCEFAPCP